MRKLPPTRPGYPAPDDLLARRELAGRAARSAAHDPQSIGGVRCLRAGSASAQNRILYFHGGGYRMGSPEGWIGFAELLAEAGRAEVTLPDYRLAPENPFPAALHDAAAVYQHLVGSDSPVFVAGDSAGGGLAAALVVLCAEEGARVPDGIILLSPWLDLSLTSDTYASRAESDRFFPLASARDAAEAYLQGHPAEDPLASPVRADLSAFPPTLMMAGTEETLLGDALRFGAELATAGRDLTLWIAEGMQHAWPSISPELPETAQAIEAIGAFIDRVRR